MNSKNKKMLAILIVALITAAIAAVSIYFFLSPQKTTVYVFKDNYKAGEAVTEEMLTTIQCDSKIVTAGKSADTSSKFVTGKNIEEVLNTGDSLRMDVAAGMPLTLSLLSVNGGSNVEMNMDPAKIAVSVPADSITAITNELKEGSRVNIYTTGEDLTTVLLFQNMRVLAVNRDSSGMINSLTLEVNAEESVKLINAVSYSSLYFGLIDSSGYEYVEGNAE